VPFMWNGVNYLLKMASDLDYLDQHKGFKVSSYSVGGDYTFVVLRYR
jgi:hypothetical protein